MKRYACDIHYDYNRQIDYFILTEDIAVVRIIDTTNSHVVNLDYFLYHPNYIQELKFNYSKNENITDKYKHLYIFPEEFIELYRTTIYGSDEFYQFFEEIYYTPENLFNLCADGRIDETTLVYTSYDSGWGTFYRYDYNAENTFGDWIPHPVKFDRTACYMVTNRDYDIDAVAEVVKNDIEEGKVILVHDSRYDDDEIVRDIEAYNADGNYTKYINFYIIAETAEEAEYDNDHVHIGYKNKLEPFRLRK